MLSLAKNMPKLAAKCLFISLFWIVHKEFTRLHKHNENEMERERARKRTKLKHEWMGNSLSRMNVLLDGYVNASNAILTVNTKMMLVYLFKT